jgi:tetratricopeptide (TPR) repeat protein
MEASLLVVAVVAPASVVVVIWMRATGSGLSDLAFRSAVVVALSAVTIGAAITLLFSVEALSRRPSAMRWCRPPHSAELLRGAATLSLSLLAVGALLVAVSTTWPASPALRLAGAALPVVIALWAIGVEWARRSLLIASVVGLLGLAAVLVAIGYDDLRQSPIERIDDVREAAAELSGKAVERQASLRARSQQQISELAGLAAGFESATSDVPLAARRAAALRRLLGAVARADRYSPVTRPDPTVAVRSELSALSTAFAPTDTSPGAAALAQTEEAIERWLDWTTYSPSRRALDASLRRASACVRSERSERAPCEGPGAATLGDVVGEMELELARYRAAVTGAKDDRQAAEEMAASLANDDRDPQPVTFLAAMQRGPEAVSVALNGERAQPLVPGVLGWVVIAGLAIGLWSWLLRVNAGQLAGPVEIEPVASGAPGSGDAAGSTPELSSADAVLRVAVLQNIEEPGAVPGSEAMESVTALVAIPGVDPGWLGKLVEVLNSVIGRKYGYTVHVHTLLDADGPEDRQHVALARVKDRRTGSTLATRRFEDKSQSAAVEAAGLWASGFILDRSTRVPSWATWNVDTAGAISALTSSTVDVAMLEKATRVAPNSGLLLYKLGGAYEMAGRGLDALDAIARAVANHPEYAIARYRLGAALHLTGAHRAAVFSAQDRDRRMALMTNLSAALRRSCLRASDRAQLEQFLATLRNDQLSDLHAHRALMGLAELTLQGMERRAGYVQLAAATLRRSERVFLMSAIAPSGKGRRRRALQRYLPWSARMIHASDASDASDAPDRDRMLRVVHASGAPWQIVYNAACAHAVDLRLDDALEALEACVVLPNEQLSADWLRRDPDLLALHEHPRFKLLLERVGGGTA